MSAYTNKWLSNNCPIVNEFIVDKSKDDYYIQYFETKDKVSALNNDWINIKKTVDELKSDINELRSAIDSEDYKAKTNDLIKALDESVVALDNNFTKLFNSVVRRMEESAASDDWFAETASLYAAFIATAILGNKYGKSSGKVPTEYGSIQAGPNILDDADSFTGYGSSSSSQPATTSGGNGGGGSVSPASAAPDTPQTSNDVPDNAPSNASGSDQGGELTATNVQYSASPSGGVDTSKYTSRPERGFVVTTDNPKYNLSSGDIELITAIVSAESDKSYDDALAVASTIFNRCETPKWASCGGSNPVKQATAPGQFVVYQHGSYKKYMGSGAPDTCRQAVLDVINGVRNHDYLSFRSNGSTKFGGSMITSTGNRYK